jgi:hypothetical protein
MTDLVRIYHRIQQDILRKATYKDYYESRDKFFQQSPEIVRTHVGEHSS